MFKYGLIIEKYMLSTARLNTYIFIFSRVYARARAHAHVSDIYDCMHHSHVANARKFAYEI